MSVLIDSLKKQNAFLQAEVERFAAGVDSLAQQLAAAQERLRQYEPESESSSPPSMIPSTTTEKASET